MVLPSDIRFCFSIKSFTPEARNPKNYKRKNVDVELASFVTNTHLRCVAFTNITGHIVEMELCAFLVLSVVSFPQLQIDQSQIGATDVHAQKVTYLSAIWVLGCKGVIHRER